MAETKTTKGGKIGGAIALIIAAIIAFLFLRKKVGPQPICTPGQEKCIGLDKCRCKDDGTGWIVVTPNATECQVAPGLAILYGTVDNAQTNAVIAGIVVDCGGYTDTTKTDGTYRIENILPGSYSVSFTDPSGQYEEKVI